MPTYEYQCENCRDRFEVRQRFVEEPLSTCPKCSGPVHRVYHPVGIVFKGSGFYVTDNRKSGESTGTAAASGTSTTSETKSGETKTSETKPVETKAAEAPKSSSPSKPASS